MKLLLSLIVALALTGCAATPQQQRDKAHQLYVQGLTTADQLVLQHKIPPATERLIKTQLIPDAQAALAVVDASVATGGVNFNIALNAFYTALEKLAEANAAPTTKPSR